MVPVSPALAVIGVPVMVAVRPPEPAGLCNVGGNDDGEQYRGIEAFHLNFLSGAVFTTSTAPKGIGCPKFGNRGNPKSGGNGK
jgi:hypothetical protein